MMGVRLVPSFSDTPYDWIDERLPVAQPGPGAAAGAELRIYGPGGEAVIGSGGLFREHGGGWGMGLDGMGFCCFRSCSVLLRVWSS